MFIALAFAHFSTKLLLKEQMTLNNAGHIDAKLIDFSEICQKKSDEIGCFLLIVNPEISREVGQFFREFAPENPTKFDFSPAKLAYFFFVRISTFFPRENPAKSADFSANLPLKIPRNFAFFPRNIRSPVS